MTTLIIFTRIDTATRPYMRNFFPGEIFDENYEFGYLHFKANDQRSDIIFINDETPFDDIDGISNIMNAIPLDNQVSVYYHKSSIQKHNHIIKVRKILNNISKSYIEFGPSHNLGDHHNGDGFHYEKIVGAANSIDVVETYNEYISQLNLHKALTQIH